MPDERLKQILVDAHRKGATKEQLDVIVQQYEKKYGKVTKDSTKTGKKQSPGADSESLSASGNGNSSSESKKQFNPYSDSQKRRNELERERIKEEQTRLRPGQEKVVETRDIREITYRKNVEKKNKEIDQLQGNLNFIDRQEVLKEVKPIDYERFQQEDYQPESEEEILKKKSKFLEKEFKYENVDFQNKIDSGVTFPNLESFGFSERDVLAYMNTQANHYADLINKGIVGDKSEMDEQGRVISDMQTYRAMRNYVSDRQSYLWEKARANQNNPEVFQRVMEEYNSLPQKLESWAKENLPDFTLFQEQKADEAAKKYLDYKDGAILDPFVESMRGVGLGVINWASDTVASVADMVGLDGVAESVRAKNEYGNAKYTNPLTSYVFETGKQVEQNGTNYLVTAEGRILDLETKLDVTNIASRLGIDVEGLYADANKSQDEISSFSFRNSFVQGGQVVGFLIPQLLGTKGVGNLLGGSSNAMRAGGAITAGGMMYATTYEDTLATLREFNIDEETAKYYANEAGISSAFVTAATSIFAYNPQALKAFQGSKSYKELVKEFVKVAQKDGVEVAKKNFTQQMFKVLGEASGEGVTEIVQENLEGFMQSVKAGEINVKLGKEILNQEYGIKDVVTNSVLAFSVSGLMAAVGSSRETYNSKEILELYSEVGRDVVAAEQVLDEYVRSGLISEAEKRKIYDKVKAYTENINKIPTDYPDEYKLQAVDLLDQKRKLETKKQNVDPAFHEEINEQIKAIDQQIKNIGKQEELEVEEEKTTNKETKAEKTKAEQKTAKPQPTELSETSKEIIDEVKRGEANLDDEIDTQKNLLEFYTERYGEDSKQVQEVQQTISELESYKSNAVESMDGELEVRLVDGKPEVTHKRGNKVSQKQESKAIREAVKNGLYDSVSRALDDAPKLNSDEEVSNYIADNSENPLEVAEEIQNVKSRSESNENTFEDALLSHIRKGVNENSFIEHSDRNHITPSIRGSYLKKSGGRTLDQIAQDVESELYGDYNANAPRVTEQMIVDFILENPSVTEYESSNKSNEQISLENKFTELTGLPASRVNIDAFSGNKTQDTQQSTSQQSTNQDETDAIDEYADEMPFSVKDKNDKSKGVSAKGLQKKFPDAIVVQSESELPKPVQDKIRRQKVNGYVKGLFYNGQVYLVADNLRSSKEAERTYRHEQIGHRGVINYLGERLAEYAIGIVENAKGSQLSELKRMAERYGLPTDFSKMTNEEKQELGEEYIAHISENSNKYPKLWDDLVNFIKQALRDFGIDLNVTKSEIRDLIRRVEKSRNDKRTMVSSVRSQPSALYNNQSTFKPISKRQLNQLVRGLQRAFKKAGKKVNVHLGAKKAADRLRELSRLGYNVPRTQRDFFPAKFSDADLNKAKEDARKRWSQQLPSNYSIVDISGSVANGLSVYIEIKREGERETITVRESDHTNRLGIKGLERSFNGYTVAGWNVADIQRFYGDLPTLDRDLQRIEDIEGYISEFKEKGWENTTSYKLLLKELEELYKKKGVPEEKHVKFLQTKDGTIYGFVDPVTGDIYIDGELMNANTPIHEFAHLWISSVQQTNPKLWERMVNVAKQTPEWKRLANDPNYKQGQLKGKKGKALDNAIADEVWASIIGNRGENNFDAILEKMNGDRTLAQKVWDAVRDFWQAVVDLFYDAGIFEGAIEEHTRFQQGSQTNTQSLQNPKVAAIADMALGQMMSGEFGTADPVMDFAMQYASESELLRDAGGNVTGVKPEVLEEIRKEREQIETEARANGTWMKAPNGKKSNLTEEQWVTVRTKRFKDWFGDWELTNKLDLINNIKPTSVKHNNFTVKQIEEIYGNLKEETNKYDSRTVRFVNNTLGKILRHKGVDAKQIVPQLKDIFKDAVPIISEAEEQRAGHKPHNNFKGYHHYLGKALIEGKEMYVRFTVQELNAKPRTLRNGFNPNELHSTFISDIEIYNATPAVTSGKSPTTNTGDGVVMDTKLRQFFENARNAQENVSKVVDENGEPLVVYHGTDAEFTEFLKEKQWSNISRPTYDAPDGFYFAKDKKLSERYGGNIMEVFIGKVETPINNSKIVVATEPNQIKSATDNVGTFDSQNNDIRFGLGNKTKSKLQKFRDSFVSGRDLTLEIMARSKSNKEAKNKAMDIWKGAKRGFNLMFRSGGGLTKEVSEIVKQLGRDQSAILDKLSYESKQLKRVVAKATKGMTPQQFNETGRWINAYLAGQKVDLSFMGDEALAQLDFFRARIDELSDKVMAVLNKKVSSWDKSLKAVDSDIDLSNKISSILNGSGSTDTKNSEIIKALIDSGYKASTALSYAAKIIARDKTLNLIKTIQENKGKYMNRSYEIFHNPKYVKELKREYRDMGERYKRRFDNSVTYLMSQGYSKKEAEIAVREYISDLTSSDNFGDFIVAKTGRANAPFLKGKKEIPLAFRELMGEVKDPTHNYIRTVFGMADYLANLSYQESLRNFLLDSGVGGYTPTDNNYELISSQAPEWSLLHGIYVPIEFKTALGDASELGVDGNDIYKAYVRLTGYTKVFKTVWSPTTVFRNLYSGVFLGLKAGHFFLFHPKATVEAFNQAFGTKNSISSEQAKAFREKLITLGIIQDGVNSGELRATLNDFKKPLEQLVKPNLLSRIGNAVQKAYSFGDDFYKVVGFITEANALEKSGMSRIEAELKAAERVRGGYPTYSYLPKGMKALRRFPLLGTFVSFPYEEVRTTKNNALYIIEDFREGRTELAMKRLAGWTIPNVLVEASITLANSLMGWDDEEDEAIRELLPEYQRNAKLLRINDDDSGTPQFIDISSLVPSETWVRPLMTLLGGRSNHDTATEQIWEAFKELTAPYLSWDITTKTLDQLINNRDEFDRKIREGDSATKDAWAVINHYLKQAGPGVYNNITEVLRANDIAPEIVGKKVNDYGREYTNKDALMAFFGIRATTLNVAAGLQSYAYTAREKYNEANDDVKQDANTSSVVTKEKANRTVSNAAKRNKEISEEAFKIIEATRKLGLSEKNIYLSLKDNWGLNQKDMVTIMAGGTLPVRPISEDTAEKTVRKKELNFAEEKAGQLNSSYIKNAVMFNKTVKEQNMKTEIENARKVIEYLYSMGELTEFERNQKLKRVSKEEQKRKSKP